MTGSEIRKKLNSSEFMKNAMAFSNDLFLESDTPASALEFLTLFCVSLSTKEYKDDEDTLYLGKLSKTYSRVKSKLENGGRICTVEFLKNPPEKLFFVLWNNTSFILE